MHTHLDLDAQKVFDELDVFLAVFRQVLELSAAGNVRFPSGQRLVDNLDLFEDAQIRCWNVLKVSTSLDYPLHYGLPGKPSSSLPSSKYLVATLISLS